MHVENRMREALMSRIQAYLVAASIGAVGGMVLVGSILLYTALRDGKGIPPETFVFICLAGVVAGGSAPWLLYDRYVRRITIQIRHLNPAAYRETLQSVFFQWGYRVIQTTATTTRFAQTDMHGWEALLRSAFPEADMTITIEMYPESVHISAPGRFRALLHILRRNLLVGR